MKEHQLINQDSGNQEWYTPADIIERARLALGGVIELDPFSCESANKTVMAEQFYTQQDDGFKSSWQCKRVWCNHPFSKDNNKRIAAKAISEFEYGAEIVMITFAATSEAWFRPLMALPQCFIYGRTNYLDQHGRKINGVTKGSVITYLGHDLHRFADAFCDIGEIKVSW